MSHDPPKQSLDYHSPQPATSWRMAPAISVALGLMGVILDGLFWQDVFFGKGSLAIPTVAAGFTIIVQFLGVFFGIMGYGPRTKATFLAVLGITSSFLSFACFCGMAIEFLRHLPVG